MMDGDSERSGSVAPDGGQPRTELESDSSSSSSSSEDERLASPPPNKRRKYSKSKTSTQPRTYCDPRVDTLMSQMNYISNYIACNLPSTSQQQYCTETSAQSDTAPPNQFLSLSIPSNPSTTTLSLGEVNIDHDERRVVPPANSERLKELCKLQQFDSQAWKGIRYKKVMQSQAATPGFIGLKINEELCHFNKTKDYLASTETLMASLSNVVLEQKNIIQRSLQDILDWASKNPSEINGNNLLEKFTLMFGPGSASAKNFENALQMVCGKRAECIELRRDRILKEIGNTNLRATLQNVPPSAEYLFSREALQPIVNSLGGSQTWLDTPTYLKKRPQSSYQPNSFHKQNSRPSPNKNTNFKGHVKRPKFVAKKPFRGNRNPDQTNTNPKQN